MADIPTPAPARLSRYRSQRTAQEAPAQDATRVPQISPLPEEEEQATVDDQVSRAKSRYRRTLGPSDGIQDTVRPKTAPSPAEERTDVATDLVQRRRSQRESGAGPIIQANLQRRPSAKRYRDSTVASPPVSPAVQPGASDPEARKKPTEVMNRDEEGGRRRLRERQTARQDSVPKSPPASPPTQKQPSVKELFPPPKPEPVHPAANPVFFNGPPSSSQIQATKSMSALPKFVDSEEEDDDAGCLKLFRRKKAEPVSYTAEKSHILRPKASKASMSRSKTEPKTIKPGGGGIVPGIDAPISAVNARDREVMVVCGKSKAMFPVTPTTTPVDIMKSAAKSMPQRIDVQSAVLLEDFVTVGVQRPLRRYEHIRDVMNSWDVDKQNCLILVDPGTGSSEAELSISGVPPERPEEDSWLLEFSQKVGKWDKRMVTLKSDGQITAQKDLNKPHEQTNICHLSDFDIYRPTQEKVRKKIKPPKRYCFAVKSQQKTAMFESTHDFVHFFCTGDRPTADAFYTAVQEWRSWYLVNVMGEGRKPRQTKGALEKALKEMGVEDDYVKSDRHTGSLEGQNQLNSFKSGEGERIEKPRLTARSRDVQPLAPDAGRLEQSLPTTKSREVRSAAFITSSNQLDPTVSPERRTTTARKSQFPSAAMSKKAQLAEDEPLGNLARKESVKRQKHQLEEKPTAEDEPLVNLARRESVRRTRVPLEEKRSNSDDFAPTGLLGRSYSQRQKDTGLGRSGSVNRRRPSLERTGSSQDEFAETGLLGRRYSQRRKEYAERESQRKPHSDRDKQRGNPFTSGANLGSAQEPPKDDFSPRRSLDSIQGRYEPPRPKQHVRRNSGDERGLNRSNSTRAKEMRMPKPLVDLTPQYREPPQHVKRKGKGFSPDQIGEGGLIDSATSPEDTLGIPPSTDWRLGRNNATNTQNAPTTSVSRNAANARSTKRPQTARETPAAFTGEGLLGGTQAKQGWGKAMQGRGVTDMSKAKGPMVDLSVESRFAQGSLVANVEADEGVPEPVIDRSREEGLRAW